MITIEIKNDRITPALTELSRSMGDLTPLMGRLARYLMESTQDRFPTGRAPDGSVWAPKSPVTIASQGGRKSNHYDTRPLYGPSGYLSSQFGSAYGPDFAEVSTSAPYAAVQQFGAAKGAFGQTSRGAPIPWGNIPARPFLGISAEDETAILDIVSEWFESAATGGA